MKSKEREEALTLELLQAIEKRSDVSQRHLARSMGVALGLANSYLRRCTRKGLIKIQQAPANRYLYYLTPKGFAEKSRLTAEYLSISLRFYRSASDSCASALEECRRRGAARIGLYGASDLAEIAALRALEQDLEIACLCDPLGGSNRFFGANVVKSPEDAAGVDIWLLTVLSNPQAAYSALCAAVGAEKVVVVPVLGLNPPAASN